MTTGKNIALTIWIFVSKVMSLLFNMLSWLVIAFLSRSKFLLISWLQSPSAVIFGAQENKISHFIANRWGNNENSERFYFLGLQKSLQMVTVTKKLKETCSLKEKL